MVLWLLAAVFGGVAFWYVKMRRRRKGVAMTTSR